MSTPLMPKSTAVWLVENTSLTFEQISKFCNCPVFNQKMNRFQLFWRRDSNSTQTTTQGSWFRPGPQDFHKFRL